MSSEIIWMPQPGPQKVFVECPFRDCFYGGAAGGGKSDGLLGDYIAGVPQFGGAWHGLLVRQSFPMLEELESRALELFSPHFGVSAYKRGRRTWEFPTPGGTATLKLRAVEEEADALKHQGQSYTWIGLDELTQWRDDKVMEYLNTRLRPRDDAPNGDLVPLYLRSTGNPGGIGHQWVKDRYRIGLHTPMKPWVYYTDPVTGQQLHRVFIPATLEDNKILMKNDPTYRMTLDAIADPVLRKALKFGDWNIAMGAAFTDFQPDIHVIDDGDIPANVVVYRTCDWGFDKPYWVGWAYMDFDGVLTFFNEMYGWGGKPNVGSRLAPEVLAQRILEFENSYDIQPVKKKLDPQCWAEHGGESIYKLLGGYKLGWTPWPKGPGSRAQRKQIVHSYLQVVNGKPRVRIMRRCRHLIRTLPILPTDRNDPTVINSLSEDHAYDGFSGLLLDINPNAHIALRRRYEEDTTLILTGSDPDRGGKYGGH